MNLYEKILVVILCLIFVGELLTLSYYYVPNKQPTIEITQYQSFETGEYLNYNLTFSIRQGTYPLLLRVVLMPILQPITEKPIYVYYDENYPSSFVSRLSWIGFVGHLLPSLTLRGYSGTVEIVNAQRLRQVMLNDTDSVIIIPSGVFPDTVYSQNDSLVGQYLKSGGTLFWMGDAFAFYSGHFQGHLTSSEENPGWEAQNSILGFTLFNSSSQIEANLSSPLSYALDLNYPGIRFGAFINQTLASNGLVLGKVNDDRTSIAAVPVGKGFLVLFGGEVGLTRTETGEDVVADDVAKILLSNVLQSNGQTVVATINRENITNETLTLQVPKTTFKGMFFLVYSTDNYSYFLEREMFPS